MEWKKKKNIRFELLGPQCKAPNYWRQNQSPFENGSQANSHLSKLQNHKFKFKQEENWIRSWRHKKFWNLASRVKFEYLRLYVWRCATRSSRPNRWRWSDGMRSWGWSLDQSSKSRRRKRERRQRRLIRRLILPSLFCPSFSTMAGREAKKYSPLNLKPNSPPPWLMSVWGSRCEREPSSMACKSSNLRLPWLITCDLATRVPRKLRRITVDHCQPNTSTPTFSIENPFFFFHTRTKAPWIEPNTSSASTSSLNWKSISNLLSNWVLEYLKPLSIEFFGLIRDGTMIK